MCTKSSSDKPSFLIKDILKSKDKEDRGVNISESSGVFRPYYSYEKLRKLSDPRPYSKYYEEDKYESMRKSVIDYGFNTSRLHSSSLPTYLDHYGSYYAHENLSHWSSPAMMSYCINSGIQYGTYRHSSPGIIGSIAKRKGGQVRFTPQQTQNLEKRFVSHKYLSPEDRKTLADQLKLSDRQVKTWFQNRRAKWRRANNIAHSECEDIESDNQSEEDLAPLNMNKLKYSTTAFVGC